MKYLSAAEQKHIVKKSKTGVAKANGGLTKIRDVVGQLQLIANYKCHVGDEPDVTQRQINADQYERDQKKYANELAQLLQGSFV